MSHQKKYQGIVHRRKTGEGTAVTAVTAALNHVTISIPAGLGGRLIGVEVAVKADLETVVFGGGWVNIHNDSEDWVPFEFFLPGSTMLTSGTVTQPVYRVSCSKYLPGNSDVLVDFQPRDDQSQFLAVTVVWELGVIPVKKQTRETFSKTTPNANWKKAAEITSVARTGMGAIAIPGHKGGVSYAMGVMHWSILTTTQSLVEAQIDVEADSHGIIPTHFMTDLQEVVGVGGIFVNPGVFPHKELIPSNSNFTFYSTGNNATSAYTIGGEIFWERPYGGSIY